MKAPMHGQHKHTLRAHQAARARHHLPRTPTAYNNQPSVSDFAAHNELLVDLATCQQYTWSGPLTLTPALVALTAALYQPVPSCHVLSAGLTWLQVPACHNDDMVHQLVGARVAHRDHAAVGHRRTAVVDQVRHVATTSGVNTGLFSQVEDVGAWTQQWAMHTATASHGGSLEG
jgi:hypothetical protein